MMIIRMQQQQQQRIQRLKQAVTRTRPTTTSSILLLLLPLVLLGTSCIIVTTVATTELEQQQEQRELRENSSWNFQYTSDTNEDDKDDDDDDDPFQMVRVVVTIHNNKNNLVEVHDQQQQQEPIDFTTTTATTVKTTATGTTTTTSSLPVSSWSSLSTSNYLRSSPSSSSSSSNQQQSFVPQPWIASYGGNIVSQLQRTKSHNTTVLTIQIPKYVLKSQQLHNDPIVESILLDHIVHPSQDIISMMYHHNSDNGIEQQQQQQQQHDRERSLQTSVIDDPEEIGYAIPMITGTGTSTTTIPSTDDNDDNQDCFQICIVDGGVLSNHPDLPFQQHMMSSSSSNYKKKIWGTTFNLRMEETWDRPIYNHGSHIMGIMSAMSNNKIGIQGVIGESSSSSNTNSNTNNICYIVARVFDDYGNGQFDSYILNAVEWCVDNHSNVRIINLSLGSSHSNTEYAKSIFDQINQNNTLIISSSGNTYDNTYNYPASFDSVISVGAIDMQYQRANFSTYNDQVNLVAPGVNIKSTVAQSSIIIPSLSSSSNDAIHFPMSVMDYSPRINIPISGTLVDCLYARSDFDCPSSSTILDKVCIAQRGGGVSYYEQALTCQRSGGIGLIIYNDVVEVNTDSNSNGPLYGSLNITGDWINIPVVGISKQHGDILVSRAESTSSKNVIINMVDPGYAIISGTSMATSYVSGVAAKIWSTRPHCTNEQIRSALFSSAKKLKSSSSTTTSNSTLDELYFGHGLVQMEGAYQAILQMPYPCGEVGRPANTTTNTTTAGNTTTRTNATASSSSTTTSPAVQLTQQNVTTGTIRKNSTGTTTATNSTIQTTKKNNNNKTATTNKYGDWWWL